MWLPATVGSAKAPAGIEDPSTKSPADKVPTLVRVSRNGKTPSTPGAISTRRGRMSKIPAPARTEVFPFLKGSHEIPNGGSKINFVVFRIKGLPRKGWGRALFKTRRLESLPLTSEITEAIS